MTDYLAITGGVGGAKLSLGLAQLLNPHEVAFAVNTGDDFEHLGFAISPDIDTLTYTLADLANTREGWGRADESWAFMETMEQLGGETWFRLGDRDLATHLFRTSLFLPKSPFLSRLFFSLSLTFTSGITYVPPCDDTGH